MAVRQRPYIPGLPWNKNPENVGGLVRQLPTGEWVLDPGSGVDVASGTYLLSGATISWETGYTYRVGSASYYIDGTLYSSLEQTVTLAAADGTYDRIDVLVLDTTGTLNKITGTPSANPAEPVVDPSVYLRLGIVIVSAGSSTPTITTTTIWDEAAGGEWTTVTSGSGWTVGSTNNPYQGTKDIELVNVASGSLITFTKPSGTLDVALQDSLIFFIRLKATWPSQKSLNISWLDASAVTKGVAVTVKHGGAYGFDRTIVGTYQQIVIPTSAFAVPAGSLVTKLRVAINGGGGSVGGYLDFFNTQVGSTPTDPSLTVDFKWRADWSSATTYQANDAVVYGNATWFALLPSTNQVPGTAGSIYWAKLGITSDWWKQPVRVATAAAGTLATSFANGQTVDGVVLATGDRILIKNQAAGAENGLYIVQSSGAPVRAEDCETGARLVNATVMVSEGTANADTMWTCTTNSPITLGTTPLVWSQAGGGTGVTDGDKGDITVSGTGTVWTVDNDTITDAKLRNSAATSVIGRSAGTSGDPADIAAVIDDVFLRRRAGALGFGGLVAADIPSLAASIITSGLLALARGGTHADLSGTGPGFLKQATTGADVSVAPLANTDLPNNNRDSWAVLIVGDGSASLTTGLVVGGFYLPPGTILKAALYSTLEETGSINADIIADSLGSALTYPGDKISASDPIVISTAKFGENTSLTGWTTATTGSGAGKLGRLYINSVSGFTQLILLLQIRR